MIGRRTFLSAAGAFLAAPLAVLGKEKKQSPKVFYATKRVTLHPIEDTDKSAHVVVGKQSIGFTTSFNQPLKVKFYPIKSTTPVRGSAYEQALANGPESMTIVYYWNDVDKKCHRLIDHPILPTHPQLGRLTEIHLERDIDESYMEHPFELTKRKYYRYIHFPIELDLKFVYEDGEEGFKSFLKSSNTFDQLIDKCDPFETYCEWILKSKIHMQARSVRILGKDDDASKDVPKIHLSDHKFMLSHYTQSVFVEGDSNV